MKAALEGGAPVPDREFPLPLADGTPAAIQAAASPFRVGEEGHAGALLVFRDVSRLRQLEEQVRRSDRLASLGTLAAGMAHEIRNPLVSIKTFGQLFPRKYQDAEFRDTFAPIIVHEVERIDTLVRQLLDFAAPREATLAPVALHGIIEESIHLTHHRLRSGRIQVVRRFEAAQDRIAGDHRLLEQAFINLFLNAGDAMDDAGCLTVSTKNAPPATPGLPGRLVVRVADTGEGIAPADLPRVFDPFFMTKANGTGLGLSVVHSIVEDHHGQIQVRSASGEGTTFEMVFPLAAPGEAPA